MVHNLHYDCIRAMQPIFKMEAAHRLLAESRVTMQMLSGIAKRPSLQICCTIIKGSHVPSTARVRSQGGPYSNSHKRLILAGQDEQSYGHQAHDKGRDDKRRDTKKVVDVTSSIQHIEVVGREGRGRQC